MIGDPRFTTNSARMKNRDALIAWMAECTRARTTDYWVSAFEDAGVPAGPVNDINQVLSNPQTKARDMVISVDHAIAGEVKALGLPIKFSNGDGVSRRGAPLYGEHTREVLLQHGYAEEEIANLSAAGVIHALAS